MKKEPLVSVVVPVYNVEKYLDRCISSIVNQTYRNLEILIVDDGSPDRCPEMCDEWAKKDGRIRVIHKQNQGQGIARNDAIEIATGDYICFIDSDDYISPVAVEESVSLAQEENADFVIFGFDTVDHNGEVISSFIPCPEPKTFTGNSVIEDFFPEYIASDPCKNSPRKYYMSIWVSLYSMEMIRNAGWRFVSERVIISEDVYSLLRLMPHVKKVAVLPKALYCYCENSESFSRYYKAGRYEKIKHFYNECVKLCNDLGYSKDVIHRVSKPYVAYTIATLKQECIAPRTSKEKKATIKSIIDDDVLQKVLQENRHDAEGIARKILFFAIRKKMYAVCYLLLKLRA